MISSRRFGALVVASVIAVALIPLQALPASALGSPATPKATTADKLAPLPSDKTPKPKLDVPIGDFSNPPPAHVEQAKTHAGVSSFDPAKSKLVEQSERVSTYENPDGSRTAKISQDVQNAKDDKGVWHSIDNNVSKKSDGHLHNQFGQTDVQFGDFADNDNVADVKNGNASVGFSLVGAKGGKAAKADKDTVTYSDVIGDNTDLRYQVGSTQLKETIVLNTKPATAPTYRFKINADKVTPSTDADGTIVFKSKDGTVVFRIPKGVAWDSSSADLNTTHPVDITLSSDNKYIDVSTDQAFLDNATYPVFLDPTIDSYWLGGDDHGRANDSPVESARHTQNFNGAGQLYASNNRYQNVAGAHSDGVQYLSQMWFDMSPINGQQINSASLKLLTYDGGTAPLCIYPTSQSWNENTLIWDNRPNHYGNCNTPSDPDKIATMPPVGTYSNIDMTTWVQQWTNGSRPNYGMTFDTAGAVSIWHWGATENRSLGGDAPYLYVDYSVPQSTPTGPTNGGPLMTATPTLTSTTATNPGASIQYWYRVSNTDSPESGGIINSGWQNSPNWSIPDGSLIDGVTYSWYVLTKYGTTGAYNASPVWKFKVNLRLGQQSVSPMDSEGPVSVNLANGNVTTGTSSPSFPTVGGDVGVSYNYNSKAQTQYGLTARYYPGCDANHNPVTQPYIVRRESTVDLSFPSSGPGPSIAQNGWCATLDGYITVPRDNTYQLETTNDDGVRVKVGTQTLVDRWYDQATGTPPWGQQADSYGFTGLTTVPIHIDWYNNGGGAFLQLWISGPNVGPLIVPSTWLTTSATALSQGWNLSADTSGSQMYSKAIITSNAVVLVDTDGETHEYRRTNPSDPNSGFTPPGDERATLSVRPDGTYVAQADDGMIYQFNTAGALTNVMSSTDDLHPAAPTYTYDPQIDAARLKGIVDPVSGRTMTLKYSGGTFGASPCADSPAGAGFDQQAPSGMLCEIDYWDGTNTMLYYVSGQLARILDPGGEVTDFGYSNINNVLTLSKVRDSLQADWVAQSPSTRDSDASRTIVYYNGDGTARSVQLASATGSLNDPAFQSHTYSYGPAANEARLTIAGTSPPQGFYGDFFWDAGGRTTSATDAQGITTQTSYDNGDQLTYTKNLATGRQSTAFFDVDEKLTDAYGPAPSSCFGGDNKPNGTCTAPPVAHSSTQYDTGLGGGDNGLAAAYWATPDFSGGTKFHEYLAGQLSYGWGAGSPTNIPADNWTGRFTGRVQMANTGNYSFALNVDDGARVYIDDTLVANHWDGTDTYATFNNTTANSSHRIRVDFKEIGGNANVAVYWTPPGGSQAIIPASTLTPNYGLTTKTTTDDNSGSSPAHVVTTSYANPAYGLATSSSEDPTGLNLTSTAAYETAGSTGYLRRTSRTLPGGNSYTYTYYGVNGYPTSVSNPCVAGSPAVDQGGMLRTSTAPTGSSGTTQVDETIYDISGQVVASRSNGDPWTCLTYDSRGRITQKVIPAFGAQPARTVTYNYAVGGDPLTTSVTDATGTITTVVDLLGQMVSYTDVWGKTTTYSYDQAGRETQSYSAGANDCRTTSYDSKSRVSSQGVGFDCAGALPLATTTYDGTTGELTDVTYPTGSGYNGNGTKGHIDRDTVGRTKKLTWQKADNTLITSDEVAYSQGSRVTNQLIDGTDPYISGDNFVYDAAGRLTTARTTGHTYTYGFGTPSGCGTGYNANANKNTNRTNMTDNGTTTATYCYDNADRLISTTDSRYSSPTYDSHNNTTGLGSSTMTYDAADRHMTTVSGGTTITYKRDALDRIVERTTTGSGPAIPTYRDSATATSNGATSLTINRPATTQTGDVLFANIVVNTGNSSTISAPSGWTQLVTDSNSALRSSAFWHVASVSDPASFTFTFNGTYQASGGIAAYSGVDTTTPIDDTNDNLSSSPGTSWHTWDALTSNANDRALVFSGVKNTTNVTPDSSQTERWEVSSSSGAANTHAQSEMSDALVANSGTWFRGQGTLAASSDWTGQLFLLKPGTTSTSTTVRYSFSGDDDSPDRVLNSSNAVLDKIVGVVGGAARIIHYDGSGGYTGATWQYPNIHGDTAALADQSGTKQGNTYLYDPFGQPLNSQPDNLAGNIDFGWLGTKYRETEHEGTLDTIEMGARQYLPGLGRFIQTDPVEGGSSNDYDYCDADPINCTDLAGTWPSFKKVMHAVASVASVVSMVPGPVGQAASAVAAVSYAASGDYKAAAAAAVGIIAGGGVVVAAVKAAKVVRQSRAILGAAKAAKAAANSHAQIAVESRLATNIAGRIWVGRGATKTTAKNGAKMLVGRNGNVFRYASKKGKGWTSNLDFGQNPGHHTYSSLHVNHGW